MATGLAINSSKSQMFFGGVSDGLKGHILNQIGFSERQLPVKYLGLPLISTKLSAITCQLVVDKIRHRICSWTSKFLSYAGRIQLVNSVLFHIQVFWSGALLLPKKVIKSIDAAFRNFVWTGKWDQSAMALVAWSDICVLKTEGGLGVKQLASWNRAALCKYIWLICKKQQDLWVQWAQVVLLKGESIWKVKLPNDCSWSWKQILKMRTSIKDQVWVQIGDGRQTSLFYDLWLEGGRICGRVQVREELMAWGHGSVVAKWWNAGAWHMPDSFVRKYPSLAQLISSKSLQDREDKVMWRPTVSGCFSIASCYNLLRVKQPKVNWHRLVWSSGNFPRHSFILWLVVRGRLKTKVFLASRGNLCLGQMNGDGCYDMEEEELLLRGSSVLH
ncbi:hypothetical protein SLEP1_g10479 [Rubroshorea leprosula]|uniref:Reverse transcriptase zinc-binding domain-containing protein n=1 Tax=Rubroshorea leprosula TaxID=152421 RepID=A0AAV5IE45_9ROSI|nr:hypothetical protein SLEP1_g10479 [Rubroshorea leprosula]